VGFRHARKGLEETTGSREDEGRAHAEATGFDENTNGPLSERYTDSSRSRRPLLPARQPSPQAREKDKELD